MNEETTIDPAQLLSWLDEQHREDRRQLADLAKLTASQSQDLESLVQRFEDLEQRLSGTQAQLIQFSDVEDALHKLKREIMSVVKEHEAQFQRTDAQLESRLDAQDPRLRHLARALEEFQGTLTALEGQVEAMPPRIQSQIEQATGLAKDIEALERRFNSTQARMTQLNERWAHQAHLTEALARQLQSLAGRLSGTQARLVKFSQIESALQGTRDEIILMIKDLEETWKKESRESETLREAELKQLRIALDSLTKELEPIPHLDERLRALPAEDKRLRDLISEQAQLIPPLYKAIEEQKERISYLEEQRPRITRRFDELEARIPPLNEAITDNRGKIQFLEEWVQRSAQQIDAYKRLEHELEQWRAAFIEEIRQGEQHRDRRLIDWEKVLDGHAQIIEGWRETLKQFEIAQHDAIRAVAAVQDLPARLERDRAELAEKQRLAEERIQREFAAWQEENEKRWRLFLKQYDYDWEQQVKRDADQDRRFEPLEAWREAHANRVSAELERLDENDRRILTRMVDIARYVERALEYQLAQQKKQRALLDDELRPSDFDVLVTPSRTELLTRATERSGQRGKREGNEMCA